jgi:hypothetical protein
VSNTTNIHWNNLPQEKQLQIFAAIDALAKDNPNVANQLTRLAEIKEKEPLKWAMGLKVLKIN